MWSNAQYRIIEYEHRPENAERPLRALYLSGGMCLKDASRFAAALSYARGAYVHVLPVEPEKETYQEWWLAGAAVAANRVPQLVTASMPIAVAHA